MQAFGSGGRLLAGTALSILLAAVVAVVALGAGRPGAPAPTAPPSPSPTAPPSAEPSPPPSHIPGSSSWVLDLDVASVGRVVLIVHDETGAVIDVRSGRGADSVSVPWGQVKVENIDAETLRVTWPGLPRAEELSLVITERGDGVLLDIVQETPPSDSDSIALDRVLIVAFDRPIRSEDVVATFPEPLPA